MAIPSPSAVPAPVGVRAGEENHVSLETWVMNDDVDDAFPPRLERYHFQRREGGGDRSGEDVDGGLADHAEVVLLVGFLVALRDLNYDASSFGGGDPNGARDRGVASSLRAIRGPPARWTRRRGDQPP